MFIKKSVRKTMDQFPGNGGVLEWYLNLQGKHYLNKPIIFL